MFQQGTRLRRQADPGTVGTATGKCKDYGLYKAVEVILPDGSSQFWKSHHVEIAPTNIDREEAFRSGRFGTVKDLRRTLMIEKLRGELTDVFYSMGTSDTDFYPHQFRPVLRFVESVTGRLLIADEVGLGKTIEALLIWKELEAREGARRLLIICPSMLREKWIGELQDRFRIRAEMADAKKVLERSREATVDRSISFALVSGYEALRPPRDWEEKTGPRPDLARLLSQNTAGADGALYDLVIVDEAHYARNTETSTSRLVRLANLAASNLLFLTATPIQLSSDNLFQLMRIVDPDRFDDGDVFGRLLRGNEPIVRAYSALLDSSKGRDEMLRALEDIDAAQPGDPVVKHAIETIKASGNQVAVEDRVSLARSIERISVLSTTMTRSRKREVLKERVLRQAHVVKVKLTSIERKAYDVVTAAVMRGASRLGKRDTISKLALITRQRQMASCMPAALRTIGDQIDIDEEMFEDFGDLVGGEDDGSDSVATPMIGVGSLSLGATDSKLKKLFEIVSERVRQNPTEKLVVFSFFRGTLAYLAEQLRSAGYRCHVLQGGMGDARHATLERFRTETGPSLLLSSEIGSEGIDLQFCNVLVNYDLPWNPMKVEQRIGRIDRLGQKAEKVLIFNLTLEDTIEERILLRLHERIGVFERSIGDIEQILGEDIHNLVIELFRDDLSEPERERRAEQTLQAIAARADLLDQLEAEAGNLVAFTAFLLKEIDDGRELGRFIEPAALWTFVTEFLLEKYPGTSIEAVSGQRDVWRVGLSPDAKAGLAEFLRGGSQTRGTRLAEPGIVPVVTNDPRWKGTLRPAPEVIDATHGLLLWIREQLKQEPTAIYPVAATRVEGGVNGVPPGTYVYVVDRLAFRGLRRDAKLRYGAVETRTGQRLSARDAERLVHEASLNGTTLPTIDLEPMPGLTGSLEQLSTEMGIEAAQEEARLTSENDSLCRRQMDAVIARRDRLLAELAARVDEADRSADPGVRRTLPLRKANLMRTQERFHQQTRRIEVSQSAISDQSETAAGLILVH